MIAVPPYPKALDPIINRLKSQPKSCEGGTRNWASLWSLNWPGHMHKWCFPAVLRCTSKYRPWWREIRRRRTDGRIGLASAGATARDPHPTARVSLAVGLARPHMPLSPTQFPPVPGVAHSHKGHRVALGCFCPITCGAGDRLGPTRQREYGRWPRVAVVWWPQLWSWPVGPDRTGRWICFLPSRASWLERRVCMEAPRVSTSNSMHLSFTQFVC